MSRFLEGDIKRHLFRLTVPSIGGMFAIMAFNLTDTYFVSRLGTSALAAMGFTFPVVMAVGALSIGFSVGASSIVTRALGAGNRALARRTVADCLFITVLGTLLVGFIGFVFTRRLFIVLGAEGEELELVCQYMRIWFLGSLLAVLPPVIDGCLRATGDMFRPFIVMSTVAAFNIVLDPVLIFGFEPLGVPAMGIKGAVYATLAARLIGTSLTFAFLHFHARMIDWSRPHIRELLKSWNRILKLGVPAAINQAINPLLFGVLTRLAASVGGVKAVAAMASSTRIEGVMFLVSIAYSIALGPFTGHNYGASRLSRIRETRQLSNRFAFFYCIASCVFLFFTAGTLAGIFSDDPEVIRLTKAYLLICVFGHAGVHIVMWNCQMLNTIGKTRKVLMINLVKVALLLIPLSWLGGQIYGFIGLAAGLSVGNMLAGILAAKIARADLN
jgi:putative MATE family efflux protein